MGQIHPFTVTQAIATRPRAIVREVSEGFKRSSRSRIGFEAASAVGGAWTGQFLNEPRTKDGEKNESRENIPAGFSAANFPLVDR